MADHDFSKFAKLDLAKINDMDNVLGTDVPALLAQFPSERSDESAAYAQKHSAGGAFGAPAAAAGGGGGGGGAVPGNPFASLGGGTGVDMSQWLITPSDQATYRNIFQTCNPIDGQCDKSFFFSPIHFGFVLFDWFTRGRTLLSNIFSVLPRGHMLLSKCTYADVCDSGNSSHRIPPGKVSGESAKGVLLKSKLDYETLGKVWNLSDIDQDGYLDEDEFAVAMYLCHQIMEGVVLPDSIEPNLIPPSKRGRP